MYRFIYIAAVAAQVFGAIGSAAGIPSPTFTCKAVQPAPSGCGIAGNIIYKNQEDFATSEPQIVSSVEECAGLCERRRYFKNKQYYGYFFYTGYDYQPYCRSFRYNTGTRLCELGRLETTQYVVPSSKSKDVFYNAGCYDCGGICDSQPLGAQLIDNGDFQDTLFGPWESFRGALSKGFLSSKAYYCAEDYSSKCFLSQEVNMCRGEYYAVQFDYLTVYTNKSRSAPHMMAGFGGYYYFGPNGTGAFTYTVNSDNTNPSAWKRIRGYFEYLQNEHSGPYFRFGGGGSTSIDNVYVSRIPKNPPIAAGAKNLFKNGGFENGKIAPWKTHQYQSYSNPPYKIVSPGLGSKYAISFTSTNKYDDQFSMYLAQTVPTKINTTYLMTFDIAIIQRSFTINVLVGPKNAQSKNVRRWDNGNHTFSLPIYATSRNTLVQFQVDDEDRNFGNILLDNIKIVEVAKTALFP